MTPTKDKPSFAKLLVLKAAAIIDDMREARLQRANGMHEDRRAEILQRLDELPGGAALKSLMQEEGIALEVKSPRTLRGSFGCVSKRPDNEKVSAEISNTGDGVAMARTAYHELRHVLQIAEMGQLEEGGGRRLKDVRTGHMISMMMEADAYTAEVLSAIKAAKEGKPEYLKDLMTKDDDGPNVQHARRFLKKRPFESFKDEGQFARALFTDLMLNSLDNYSTNYFGSYRMQFLMCQTLQDFKSHLDKTGSINAPDPAQKLGGIYGADFAGGVSMSALTVMFRRSLPAEDRQTLVTIEHTVSNADKLTEGEYAARRDDILKRTNSIYMKEDFHTQPPGTANTAVSRFLQQAAAADKPMTVSDFKAALKVAPQKVVYRSSY